MGMWWWCLVHAQVEPDASCAHQVRLGPFKTEAEAATALVTAKQRNKDWEENDDE